MNRLPVTAVVVAVLAAAVPAMGAFYMEFEGAPTREVPANCSTWHELYPSFCTPHHQDAYSDNGDGALSACDVITLDGVGYHIDWVGPTYILEEYGNTSYWEPMGDVGSNPVCSTWHQVYPDFCAAAHVDNWEDNDASGTVTACDYVWIGGIPYHVVEVKLDIQVTPTSPVDHRSWGTIKSLFSTF